MIEVNIATIEKHSLQPPKAKIVATNDESFAIRYLPLSQIRDGDYQAQVGSHFFVSLDPDTHQLTVIPKREVLHAGEKAVS